MMRYKYFEINYLFDVSRSAGIACICLLNQGQGGVLVREVTRVVQKLQQMGASFKYTAEGIIITICF